MRFIAVVVGCCLFLFLTGCATSSDSGTADQDDDLPWNSPAGWEYDGVGMPY